MKAAAWASICLHVAAFAVVCHTNPTLFSPSTQTQHIPFSLSASQNGRGENKLAAPPHPKKTIQTQKTHRPAANKNSVLASSTPKREASLIRSKKKKALGESYTSSSNTPRVINAKQILYSPTPPYPRLSQRHGEQGTVILNILVTKNGHVETLHIFKSSGHELLDHSALETVKLWRFTSSQQINEIAATWHRLPLTFKIKN